MKQSLDFPKPRLCPVTKVLYLYDIKVHYVSKDTLSGLQSQTNASFSQRLDKDIAGNDPVRVVDTVIDNLKLETSTNFIRSVAAVHTNRR